jgi:hypothetical protein
MSKKEVCKKLEETLQEMEKQVTFYTLQVQHLFLRKCKKEIGGFYVAGGHEDYDFMLQKRGEANMLLNNGRDIATSRYSSKKIQTYCKSITQWIQQNQEFVDLIRSFH